MNNYRKFTKIIKLDSDEPRYLILFEQSFC